MAKKRRRRLEQEQSDRSPERVLSGESPWSLIGLGEVLTHAAGLHKTPHDDWDRREKGVNLLNDDGTVSRLVFNPDMLENQVMSFIVKRLRDEGADEEMVMSHGWRFWESMAFLTQNAARLREERLVIDDPSDAEAALLFGCSIRLARRAPPQRFEWSMKM
jgi:hypothetical protein